MKEKRGEEGMGIKRERKQERGEKKEERRGTRRCVCRKDSNINRKERRVSSSDHKDRPAGLVIVYAWVAF